jgi:hypothetical protein
MSVVAGDYGAWTFRPPTIRPPAIRPPVHFFFQSRRSYRPAEGRVEAKRRQRPGPPPATTNRLLAEPGGGPCVNCAWVEVSRGRFVGGRIVKVPEITLLTIFIGPREQKKIS